MPKYLLVIPFILIVFACGKHAKKIVGEYNGVLTINDSTEITNTAVSLIEVTKNEVRVSNTYFTDYSVTIDKSRYFASKTYYAIGTDENLEVLDGDNLILTHRDVENTKYVFVGEKN